MSRSSWTSLYNYIYHTSKGMAIQLRINPQLSISLPKNLTGFPYKDVCRIPNDLVTHLPTSPSE